MSETKRPKLLFLSPVFPDIKGNGLAMRAGMFLEALSQACDAYLIVMPIFSSGGESSFALIDRTCVDWALAQPMPARTGLRSRLENAFDQMPSMLRYVQGQTSRVQGVFEDVRFDALHVFRLSMWPLAEAILARPGPRPQVHLDLDDIESDKMHATAAVRRLNGLEGIARLEEREAERYAAVERLAVAAVDRTYVCSQPDLALLTSLYSVRSVEVIPNTVPLPVVKLESTHSDPLGVFRFLFVGTLGYYPNEDAVLYFHREVLPLLRARSRRPVQLDIVGAGESSALQAVDGQPGVNLIGAVDDIAESYANANAVIVPIRAGGGTRIKALEAFAHHRPVVTTSIGIHGIEVVSDRDVLIADTPADFAAACHRLIDEPVFAASLVENAARLVRERYSQEVVLAKVRALFAPPP